MTQSNLPLKFKKAYQKMLNLRIPGKFIFYILGIASTIWFLIRVIPKPSRAGYPCMKAAAPLMSGFFLYILSISSVAIVVKSVRTNFNKIKPIALFCFIVIGIVLMTFSIGVQWKRSSAAVYEVKNPPDGFNNPMGQPSSTFPGRVAWIWNPDATNENCTNKDGDYFFNEENNNPAIIAEMVSNGLFQVTGENTIQKAWDVLFKFHNKKKSGLEKTYSNDETIFIKINQGTASWVSLADYRVPEGNENTWQEKNIGVAEASPYVVLELLNQLVNEMNVPQEKIAIGDPISHIYKHNYEIWHQAFPNVKYVDKFSDKYGRTLIKPTKDDVIFYSDNGSSIPKGTADKIYDVMYEANYLINVANLKSHLRAGISLTAKNHFGSHTRDGAGHLHPSLPYPEENLTTNFGYNKYRAFVDILGSKYLGENTLIGIVDGCWGGGPSETEKAQKWKMPPFNNDWTSSIFMSQDLVALESVCYDFLRTEFNGVYHSETDPNMEGAEDYLHQAADSKNWPKDIIYDPDKTGKPIGSLGIHEHWNNKTKMQYSRNLGFSKGIELVSVPKKLVDNIVSAQELNQLPIIDGDPNDGVWISKPWINIDQTWIPWGDKVNPSDFTGRYKIAWSQEINELYFLVEITDDVFVDGYVYNENPSLAGNYPDYDILEIFIDEDKSGGEHIFDSPGKNAENAFSYHIAISKPKNNETVSTFDVMDIKGTDWGYPKQKIANYKNHFGNFIVKRIDNRYFYEFSLKVYNDTYIDANPENSRVILTPEKIMGLTVAYCDNDNPNEKPLERDNFFGSVYVPVSEYNSHWMNADGFGSLILKANSKPEQIKTIPSFKISSLNVKLKAVSAVDRYFFDKDGDNLTYEVSSDNQLVIPTIDGSDIYVEAANSFVDPIVIHVSVMDGKSSLQTSFEVTVKPNSIFDNSKAVTNLKVYPMPVLENYVMVEFDNKDFNGDFDIIISSVDGRTIDKISGHSFNGIYKEKIYLDNLTKGVFILKVSKGQTSMSRVFLK